MRTYLSLVVFLTILLPLACAPAAEETATAAVAAAPVQGGLEGVWKVTATGTNTSPQPRLCIFTKQHYSYMGVSADQPRELLSDTPTDAERLAAYDFFFAHSGTYEVSGSTFTIRVVVARSPNYMSDGSETYKYQVEGDTLRLTYNPSWEPETETVITLTRVE